MHSQHSTSLRNLRNQKHTGLHGHTYLKDKQLADRNKAKSCEVDLEIKIQHAQLNLWFRQKIIWYKYATEYYTVLTCSLSTASWGHFLCHLATLMMLQVLFKCDIIMKSHYELHVFVKSQMKQKAHFKIKNSVSMRSQEDLTQGE